MVKEASVLKELAKRILSREARLRMRSIYYYGANFHCPVCGSNVRFLADSGYDIPVLQSLDVIGGFKENDTCPVCFSHGRIRLIWAFLTHEIFSAASPHHDILHIAPEKPLVPIVKAYRPARYVLADLTPERYPDLGRVERTDITALNWRDDSFDLIICNHVLEHIPSDRMAMAELHRVLRPDGVAILQVPLSEKLTSTIEDPAIDCPEEQERRFGQRDHVRIYGPDYMTRLREAGFHVATIDPLAKWGADQIRAWRLDAREKLLLGHKISGHKISGHKILGHKIEGRLAASAGEPDIRRHVPIQ
jgi:SAM-dependent methyltransferase